MVNFRPHWPYTWEEITSQSLNQRVGGHQSRSWRFEEGKKISCSCRESNHDSWLVHRSLVTILTTTPGVYCKQTCLIDVVQFCSSNKECSQRELVSASLSPQFIFQVIFEIDILQLLHVQPGFSFKNSTFCSRNAFLCFEWILEQTAITTLYRISLTDWFG